MASEIIIPDFGTSADQVRLIKWLKKEGETVKEGDPLCELETDKATTVLESFVEGVLLRQLVEADTEIEIGTVIAYICKEEENIENSKHSAAEETKSNVTTAPTESRPEVTGGPQETAAIKITPKIRQLAKRLGVNLSEVTATGPDGRITEEDVKKMVGGPC